MPDIKPADMTLQTAPAADDVLWLQKGDGSADNGLEMRHVRRNPFVGCRLHRTTDLVVSSGDATTKIPWDGEVFDPSVMHDNVTNNTRITIPTGWGGYWRFYCEMSQLTGTGVRRMILFKNAVELTTGPVQNSTDAGVWVDDTFLLVAGDYIEALIYQTSGSNRTAVGGSYWTQFYAEFLGT